MSDIMAGCSEQQDALAAIVKQVHAKLRRDFKLGSLLFVCVCVCVYSGTSFYNGQFWGTRLYGLYIRRWPLLRGCYWDLAFIISQLSFLQEWPLTIHRKIHKK